MSVLKLSMVAVIAGMVNVRCVCHLLGGLLRPIGL